jgi:predicted O-methyltransferase YrrM
MKQACRRGLANWLPVTYSDAEFTERKKHRESALRTPSDPMDSFMHSSGPFAHVFGIAPTTWHEFMAEAETVQLAPARDEISGPLPSPMSLRDRVLLYAMVRATRPVTAVETGVAGGCSAAMILAAMEKNGRGRLFGIDSLTENYERLGERIPRNLHSRFQLIHAESLTTLRQWRRDDRRLDFFLHDSLHTCSHARAEYELAWSLLTPGGTLASHDILYNNAFDRFLRRRANEIHAAFTCVNLGAAIRNGPTHNSPLPQTGCGSPGQAPEGPFRDLSPV